jgi:phosphoribosylformimino-5-aminoimidazole carboxamide ribotide isomerase
MRLKIYPAIDILGGKVVRLRQGSYEDVTVYNEDPADQAKRWEAAGAEILHVVDLDGASAGRPVNLDALARIVDSVKIPIQFGGGLRQPNDIEEVFHIGVERAVLGTSLIKTPELVAEECRRHPGSIVAAVDARDGKVHVDGWREGTEFAVKEILADLEILGVEYLLYTDIGVDGMLTGIDTGLYGQLIEATKMKVIASGGVSDPDDIKRLALLGPVGLEGVIVGRAIYEGAIDLAKAVTLAKVLSAGIPTP